MNYSPNKSHPYHLRRRSPAFTDEKKILIAVYISEKSWEGLKDIANTYRTQHYKMPVTRFLNNNALTFQRFNPPDYMWLTLEQQGKWRISDFDTDQRKRRTLQLTHPVLSHLIELSFKFELPVRLPKSEASHIGQVLELIGRGWISQ